MRGGREVIEDQGRVFGERDLPLVRNVQREPSGLTTDNRVSLMSYHERKYEFHRGNLLFNIVVRCIVMTEGDFYLF